MAAVARERYAQTRATEDRPESRKANPVPRRNLMQSVDILGAVGLTGGIVIGIIAILVLVFIGIYNRLVAQRMQCRSGWSQIDVQLKRRHDLIPNLVETVKGYASHERGTLEAVIQARGAAVSASGGGPAAAAQAEGMLTGALRQLLAVAEAYPDLKANENFQQLSQELSATE